MADLTPEQRANTPCFIGRLREANAHHAANAVVCVAVDRPEFAKDTAKTVARWIRGGLKVETVPVWWVRENFGTTNEYTGGSQR